MREIVNAIFYVLRGGIAWRLLPKDFPPWQTVYRWFARLRDGCVFERMNHALVMADRQRAGREASTSAAIIDSQSVKRRKSAGREVRMPARRSKDASVMLWSTAMGAPCLSNPIPPTSRTATAVLRCCKSRAPSSRSFAWSGPTAATTPNASQAPPMFALRSSAKSQIKSASLSCHAAGWSNGSSLRSIETEGSQKTSRHPSNLQRLSSTPQHPCS